MKPSTFLPLALGFVLPTALLAAVEGRVLTFEGHPLEHAEVEWMSSGTVVFTDGLGRFAFPEASPPGMVVIRHPSFQEARLQVSPEPAASLEVYLEPKQVHYEQIVVSADRARDSFSPVTMAATLVKPESAATALTNLTELVASVPGVSENGQGGHFQVVSIRGISRQRILTLVSGMRITSERRAGVSTSFLDPLLMDGVDVLRGPASTYYGSGALGGVVQVRPRSFDEWWSETGYSTQGDENIQAFGWGGDGWSLGFARRHADDSEAADGSRINSHFTQLSATLQKSWQSGGRSWQILLLPAYGEDIGKANTEFPQRTTNYPRERHLLLKLGLESERGWRLAAWVHPHDLHTQVSTGAERQDVFNETLDFGADWQREFQLRPKMGARLGLGYFARRGVDAREVRRSLTSGGVQVSEELHTLDEAEEDEAAVYGSLRRSIGRASLELGARATWLRQNNAARPSLDRSAMTGFLGVSAPLGRSFELVANLGSGLRFPSLSEQFFSGTTGRGAVLGNPDLEPERDLNADVGVRWFGNRAHLGGYVFRNRIDDYIERLEAEPGLLTFRNLTSGTIRGVELEGFLQLDDALRLTWGGHALQGRDADDRPLADIPADEVRFGVRCHPAAWHLDADLAWRRDKDDPGSGEKSIGSALLLSGVFRYPVGSGLELSVTGSNLLDEAYFNSADRQAPLSPGRSIGVGLRWSRKEASPTLRQTGE